MSSQCSSSLPKKIALVHEWFSRRSYGGAENVVETLDRLLAERYTKPQIFALTDGLSTTKKSWLYKRSIRTSFVQHLPFGKSHVQQYLPLLPYAIEQLDLSEYPIVISSSHLVAKGVLTSPHQLHLSYVHTPVRYAWDQMNSYLSRSALSRSGFEPLIRVALHNLRQWDQLSAARVNFLFANSRFTASRIRRFWGRESKVLHPPVDVERFDWDLGRADFYLCLCRLVPYKRVDLVIEAFNRLRLPLVVVGDGPERKFLEDLAGPTVKLLGSQTDSQVQDLLSRCRAFVYAALEDFGIAPVEAMASGAPVIGFGKGGLVDTVRCIARGHSSPTGVLFPEQTVEAIERAVFWFEDSRLWRQLSPECSRVWAENFRPEEFSKRFENALIQAWDEHQRNCDVAESDPGKAFDFPLRS